MAILSRTESSKKNCKFLSTTNKKKLIDEQACLLTEIIAESAASFFGMSTISTKESKGWWNKNIKIARNEVKASFKNFNRRQSLTNHIEYLNKKQTLQKLI